jgi:hypothetical protein
MFWDIARPIGAVVIALLIYLWGASMIRGFARGEPPPDPADQPLEDVDLRYQCIVCGAQAVLYAAPEGELPEPPRHCREDMRLITPIQ